MAVIDDLQSTFDTLGPDGWRIAIFDDIGVDPAYEMPAESSLLQARVFVVRTLDDFEDIYPPELGPWFAITGFPINGVHADNPLVIRSLEVKSSDPSGSVLTTTTPTFGDGMSFRRVVFSSILTKEEKKAISEYKGDSYS